MVQPPGGGRNRTCSGRCGLFIFFFIAILIVFRARSVTERPVRGTGAALGFASEEHRLVRSVRLL